MLGLSRREIESVSTGSNKYADSRDKVAKGAKQSEQALHRVSSLDSPGRGSWAMYMYPGLKLWPSPHIVTLSPLLVASHVSPITYDSGCAVLTSWVVPEGVSRIL